MNRVISSANYRITVLTERLIRLEYNSNGVFEDRTTKFVINRQMDSVVPIVRREDGHLIVETKELLLTYDEKEFTTQGLSIELKNFGTCWHFIHEHGNTGENLRGTARTLDEVDGSTTLDSGIFGKKGYAVIDDAKSPVLDGDNYVNRSGDAIDLYFFGYGKDFYAGLRDFYRLSGKTPMIPRYALGNWWSRYFKYTEESYKEVMDRFEEEQIPLSVAVIDMDWHVTEVDPKYGTGWTGYTWDKKLFPDYKRFLKMLHDRGLAVTLNLHPADGVRGCEEMYRQVAERVGIDPDTDETVEFDFGDPKFREAYFEEIMHPYEKDGVDFWWIDWQQGTGRKSGDVDPLFLLNHYHYKDQESRNVRPMIFSRYAGPGSHRYPVGFSGDTVCSWRSLAFQPYFTSTASNIGYGWWSHDIGGHMLGDKNDERLIRWIQLGVFSPIMRLHSSCSPFLNKEPWVIEEPYHSAMQKFMRLRHQMVPYLYTENRRANVDDKPLIRPMYYLCPDEEDAYNVPGEYGFGESLVVGSITEPMDDKLRLAPVNMLIPEGRYVDVLNGRVYKGGKRRKLYRDISEIPVLLPAGGILPLASGKDTDAAANPKTIELVIAAGADGSYTLYEDDGSSMDFEKGSFAETSFTCSFDKENGDMNIKISPAEGELSLIPSTRDYVIKIMGIERPADPDSVYDPLKKMLTLYLETVKADEGAGLELRGIKLAGNDHQKEVFNILERAYIGIRLKDIIYDALTSKDDWEFLRWLKGADASETLKDAIFEIYEDI
jgi:alpha-glucosidase (family GH31 glycosyl hydrolase)